MVQSFRPGLRPKRRPDLAVAFPSHVTRLRDVLAALALESLACTTAGPGDPDLLTNLVEEPVDAASDAAIDRLIRDLAAIAELERPGRIRSLHEERRRVELGLD